MGRYVDERVSIPGDSYMYAYDQATVPAYT